MNIALIKNNKVENIIVADLSFAGSLGYDEVLDTEGLTIGIGWEKIDNVWTAPNVVVPEPVIQYKSILTPYEFLIRFTSNERKRIKRLMATNEDVDDLWTLFMAAQEDDLDDPMLIYGVNALEALGCLDNIGRAVEILTKYPI